ncbi:hypothetical protein ACQKTA_08755 [Enterococcus sp. 22-H-5-01]|uniref:hypothetical protein n=1 Tax=Enterococcus sp. 22-H-5-01 TaxID=3418555 RepID=UPI003CFF945F
MKRIFFVGVLLTSLLILGACQKNETQTAASTSRSSSVKKESNTSATTSSTEVNTSSSQSSAVKESEENATDVKSDAQKQLIGKSFLIRPTLYDGEDAAQAMDENKAPQNLIHDGSLTVRFMNETTVHIKLLGTYRPDFDTQYTLTDKQLIVSQHTIPYSIDNGVIAFGTWTTDMDGHTVTWSFTPDSSSSTENTSTSSSVDTKNLTSDQFKQWVGAVLDKQFSLGRRAFSYKLSVENHDGYAYVRVDDSEKQVDTIDMFRINASGQLEEQDLSNGYPATYNVVSSKFMDTSEVTVNN